MSCAIATISGIGCLGRYPDFCAAVLAGLGGASGSPDFELFFAGDEEPRAIPVCAAPVVSHGFRGVGRLVAVLHQALVDLTVTHGRIGELIEVPWFMAVPDPLDRDIDLAELEGRQRADVRIDWLGRNVLGRCMPAAGIQRLPQVCRFYGGDETAFSLALAEALTGFERGAYERCVVGAVDSLVSEDTLAALSADNLLKTPENEYGFIPGEGAVLLVLERSAGTGGRGLTVIEACAQGNKDAISPERGDGRRLAETVIRALAENDDGASDLAVITDQNGERERAFEWGDALVHLAAQGIEPRIRATLRHAMNLGHSGMASPAFALALASYALGRQRLPNRVVVATSSFETPVCTAVSVKGG